MNSANENPKRRTVRGLSAKLNLSSGNSEVNADLSPAAKKPRTARGLSAILNVSDACEDLDDLGIYSNRVSTLFSTVLYAPEWSAPSADTDVIEEETVQKVVGTHGAISTEPLDVAPSVQPEGSLTVITAAAKDPTPPPSPATCSNSSRPRKSGMRITKAVKMAMTKLQKAQRFLNEVVEESGADDDDVIIVDGTCGPCKSRSPPKDCFITIKIRSRSGIHRHRMKLLDSFAEVISLMARLEHVAEENIIMFVNDKTIRDYDSPKTLQLTVADIVDCHIRGSDGKSTERTTIDDPTEIQLVFQTIDSRTAKRKLSIRKDEPMEKVLREYCRLCNAKYETVQFQFDGEPVEPSSTPEMLELESDFCIDVLPS